jgi:hypothetical protein
MCAFEGKAPMHPQFLASDLIGVRDAATTGGPRPPLFVSRRGASQADGTVSRLSRTRISFPVLK